MCGDATELVGQCESVLLCLPTSDVVAGVIDALGQAVTDRHCFIDTTTGEPRPLGDRDAFAADTVGVKTPWQDRDSQD